MLQHHKHDLFCHQKPPAAATRAPIAQASTVSRRGLLATVLLPLALASPFQQANASEGPSRTAPPPAPLATTTSAAAEAAAGAANAEPACASCVGYVDGTLGSCSELDVCSSSYDDRPAHFVAPWQYDGSTTAAMQKLVSTLQEFGASIQKQTADYAYAVLQQPSGARLDLEFVFAPNDTTVALRAAQQVTAAESAGVSGIGGTSSSTQSRAAAAVQLPVTAVTGFLTQLGFNKEQPSQVLEQLRLQLGWEVVPILRNRQRLFLLESPFDSFGPVPPPVPDYSKDLTDF